GRRYDSNGMPLADQFPVSTSLSTGGARVAMDAAYRFVSVFENFVGGDAGSDISALRFEAPPGPIPAKIAMIKPPQSFKFVAKGEVPLPDPAVDNPTVAGGSLSFSAASGGGQIYTLPPACWRGLGPGGDG